MGRMHAPGKGISSSALPYRRAPPSWLKTTPEDVVEHIAKLARKGLTPSQIGVTLRDSHGIPQVRFVTGNKILRILKSNGTSLFYLCSGRCFWVAWQEGKDKKLMGRMCCRSCAPDPRGSLAPC